MRHLPKAIPELDGGMFLPRPLLELLESVLVEHERMLQTEPEAAMERVAVGELRQLLRINGTRPPLPSPDALLELDDPREQMIARNLLRS